MSPDSDWLSSTPALPERTSRRLGRALSVSLAAHAGFGVLLVILLSVNPTPVDSRPQPIKLNAVYLPMTGRSGGGGGDRAPASANTTEVPRHELPRPAPVTTPVGTAHVLTSGYGLTTALLRARRDLLDEVEVQFTPAVLFLGQVLERLARVDADTTQLKEVLVGVALLPIRDAEERHRGCSDDLGRGVLVVAVVVGRFVAPRLFDVIVRMQVRYVLLVASIAFALALAGLAGLAGSALIIGAFAAGLVLSGTNQFDTIEHEVRPVASVFTPFFFVSVGASVNLALLNPATPAARATLLMAGAITLLAIIGKVAAGWAAPWTRFRRLVVGVGMVPRGEVGLIFAEIGRRSGVLGEEVFGAVLLMVMVTTFIAPPALKALFASEPGGVRS